MVEGNDELDQAAGRLNQQTEAPVCSPASVKRRAIRQRPNYAAVCAKDYDFKNERARTQRSCWTSRLLKGALMNY